MKKLTKDNIEKKLFPVKDLTTLNTKRLLSLYRSFRESFSKFIRSYYCPCCGMRYADVYGKLYSEEERKMIHKEVSDYEKLFEKLKVIYKTELSKRENIKLKRKDNK